ncbi:PREDICTED: epidermal growth factor-like protein 7 [Branchiostoma belcheri]|uniref:Epidermal growth factor-like protein 7 n=1 Tax=Branchiostoma belcheri TaxID=7741 RepID=A0A6P5AGV5_BRABE|nr:PREDICTED: epidermal growth factor-like protein 7 [Branchiostoma belcheri]
MASSTTANSWSSSFSWTIFSVCLCLWSTQAQFLRPGGKHVCQDQTQVSIPKLCVDSFAQPQYTPYMTVCDGMRLCSSYKTTYKTSYRQVYKMEASTRTSYVCCPGWTQRHKRAKGCLQPVCSKPCVHGRCIRPDTCECRRGWSGDVCDTDENECDADAHGCEQECVNSKGSFICTCRAGYRLNSDGKTCAATGEVIDAKYEALMLRVEELEQSMKRMTKMVADRPNDGVLPTLPPQIDRIGSLSEQISILEERLDDCTCRGDRDLDYYKK